MGPGPRALLRVSFTKEDVEPAANDNGRPKDHGKVNRLGKDKDTDNQTER